LGYEVLIIRSAEKELDNLPDTICDRLSKRIISLKDNPRPIGTKKLSGRDEYRLRIGAYRILYTVDDAEKYVTIVAIGHRRNVYR
jgi:mRNA interferase RelE/StbE